MKYHQAREGIWKKCRATKQPGRGVMNCELGEENHVGGRHDIAARGGGLEERSFDGDHIFNKISGVQDNGTFTVTSPKGKVSVFDAEGNRKHARTRSQTLKEIADLERVVAEGEQYLANLKLARSADATMEELDALSHIADRTLLLEVAANPNADVTTAVIAKSLASEIEPEINTTAKFMTECPQGHRSYRDTKPKRILICTQQGCQNLEAAYALVKLHPNPDFKK